MSESRWFYLPGAGNVSQMAVSYVTKCVSAGHQLGLNWSFCALVPLLLGAICLGFLTAWELGLKYSKGDIEAASLLNLNLKQHNINSYNYACLFCPNMKTSTLSSREGISKNFGPVFILWWKWLKALLEWLHCLWMLMLLAFPTLRFCSSSCSSSVQSLSNPKALRTHECDTLDTHHVLLILPEVLLLPTLYPNALCSIHHGICSCFLSTLFSYCFYFMFNYFINWHDPDALLV